MGSSSISAWRERIDGYKHTLLLLSVLALILLPLILGSSGRRPLLFGISFLVVLPFGVLAMARLREGLGLGLLLAAAAAVMQLASFVYGIQFYPQLRLAMFTAFLGFMVAKIIGDVLRAEAVTWDKINGALCAYLLIGLTWGLLFAWVGLRDPQAFSGSGLVAADYPGSPMIYYSFVTLTTLGYGDITPVSHAARTLAWLEAAFGQIYLVILVARLVSLHLKQSSNGRE
jgi:hypothetical protein